MERAGRSRRSRDAAHRRWCGRSRRRRGSRAPPPRVQRAAREPAARCGGRRRPDRVGPCTTIANCAAAARDDRGADRERGLRGRLRQRPSIQRHSARGLRPHANTTASKQKTSKSDDDTWRAALAAAIPTAFAPTPIFEFLATRAVPGVEQGSDSWYRRTLGLTHGSAIIELGDRAGSADAWVKQGWIPCRLELSDLRDLASAVARCRRLLDLDADAQAVAEALGGDPILGAAICAEPGRRSPGHVDGFELAVRAVLGQQVSVAGARTLASRLVAAHGEPLTTANCELTHLFPTAEQVAAADPTTLSLTAARAASLIGLARAVADGEIDLDPGADRDRTAAQLLALPGVGPWTVSYIRMRALADPDVFMASDLGVRRGVQQLGFTGGLSDIEKLAQDWRPWRSYALAHIWAAATAAATTRRPAATAAAAPSRRPAIAPTRRPALQLREESLRLCKAPA